ncbi:hypothetical protein [Longibaculum muris]|uniref:hypothetical protein n=1 Tax=Longibaculum muris TaxID=1796628 RepID=UPI0029422CCD|nr:hypothetical protein [Longibaculum muris]
MLGGGSLGAVGLGMTGETAFIAGGGAILGLELTTTISSESYVLLSDSNSTMNECAKLLTFVEYALLDKLHEIDVAKKLLSQMDIAINYIGKMIDELPNNLKDRKKIEKNQKRIYLTLLNQRLY